MTRARAVLATIVLTGGLAGCADPQVPPPGPVGLGAEDFPPQATAPEGVLGDAEVGVDELADPGIDTIGDPFVP